MSAASAGQRIRIDRATFLAFLETRSEEERWELVDGQPMMMPPPRIAHQRIASNLERHLNDALEARKPEWRADREIGIELPEAEYCRPEPELAVIDTNIDATRNYTDRFYLVAEVLSESDRPKVIEAKIALYRSHTPCRTIIIVQQQRVEVRLDRRRSDGGWETMPFTSPDDVIVIEEIGRVCTLRQLYRSTGLVAWTEAT